MTALELVCLAIVGLYVVARLSRPGRAAFLARFAALVCAAALAEDTVIRAYGYYAYATTWTVRIDRVPLVVVLVWPVVVDSAVALARALVRLGAPHRDLRVATTAAALVLADASLIEPIAVRAGLWRWTEPGLFGVPLVGIAGWAMFAWAAAFWLERVTRVQWAVIAVAPLATHAALLVSYALVFRWIERPIPGASGAIAAWLVAAPLSLCALRSRARVPVSELLLRVPGAAFFFALLALTAAAPHPYAAPAFAAFVAPPAACLALAVYAAAFAPPYLAATLSTMRGRAKLSPSVRPPA